MSHQDTENTSQDAGPIAPASFPCIFEDASPDDAKSPEEKAQAPQSSWQIPERMRAEVELRRARAQSQPTPNIDLSSINNMKPEVRDNG